MAIKVRTCKSLAEFQQAIGAIAEYGGWEINDEIAKRFLRVFPLDRMHAAFEGRRAVGGAGAFPFDLSVPGGSVAVRRRHRRRRLPDAPAAGDPHVDDARPARRRARARRADRSALGFRRADLRTLRLRPGLARGRDRPAAHACRSSRLRSKIVAPFATSRARTCRRCSGRSGSTSSASGRGCSRGRRSGGSPGSRRIRRSGGAAPGRGASPSSSSEARSRGTRSIAMTRSGRVVFRTPARWPCRRCSLARSRPRPLSGATSSTSSGPALSPRGCSPSTLRSGGSSPSRGG